MNNSHQAAEDRQFGKKQNEINTGIRYSNLLTIHQKSVNHALKGSPNEQNNRTGKARVQQRLPEINLYRAVYTLTKHHLALPTQGVQTNRSYMTMHFSSLPGPPCPLCLLPPGTLGPAALALSVGWLVLLPRPFGLPPMK